MGNATWIVWLRFVPQMKAWSLFFSKINADAILEHRLCRINYVGQ